MQVSSGHPAKPACRGLTLPQRVRKGALLVNGFFIAGLVVCLFISPGSARADSDLSVKELYRGFVLKAEESVAELGRDILGRKWDLAPGARHIGILTERTTLTSGFAKTFGMNLATGPFPGTLPGRDVPSERPCSNASTGSFVPWTRPNIMFNTSALRARIFTSWVASSTTSGTHPLRQCRGQNFLEYRMT